MLRTSFPLDLNVRRANVEEGTSWIIVDVTAADDEIERAVAWLLDQDIAVDRIRIDAEG
jgi:predicted type IV restriction endonuclease